MAFVANLLISSMLGLLFVNAAAAQGRLTREEHEMYSYVLTEFFRERSREDADTRETHIVIASIAAPPYGIEKGYSTRSKGAARLERRLRLDRRYSLVDEKTILDWIDLDEKEFKAKQQELLKTGRRLGGVCGPEWRRFYDRFPNSAGYYRLSRIGFSGDGRSAYLELTARGSTWHSNTSYWLRWTKRGWTVRTSPGNFSVC